MTTPETKAAPKAPAPAPRAATPILPTPMQHEIDGFVQAVEDGSLQPGYTFAHDGSDIDPQSPDPTPPGAPTWPAP
jgi:hypothetical protein